jgi:hypothetical protein
LCQICEIRGETQTEILMGLHPKSLNEKSSKGELGFIPQPFGGQ